MGGPWKAPSSGSEWGKRRKWADWCGLAGAPAPPALVAVARAPEWYNSVLSGAVLRNGTQKGSSCGLHAYNHAMAAVGRLRGVQFPVSSVADFEGVALASSVEKDLAFLLDAGGNPAGLRRSVGLHIIVYIHVQDYST